MGNIRRYSRRLRERGQGVTEYLIILALIAIAAIGVYSFFGQSTVRQLPPAAAQNPPAKSTGKDAPGAPAQAAPRMAAEPPVRAAAESPEPAAPPPPVEPAAAKETGESRTAGTR